MRWARRLSFWALCALIGATLSACFEDGEVRAHYEINLYSGVRELASLGDSWAQIAQASPHKIERIDLPIGSDQDSIKFSEAYAVPAVGVRFYLRDGRVALIELQEPFKGSVQGTSFQLFEFKPPPNKSWEDVLVMQFGPPTARASGGRLGSDALFYPWGDISYNRMGTNEIAIYRDPAISGFRQRHFGRDIGSMFGH